MWIKWWKVEQKPGFRCGSSKMKIYESEESLNSPTGCGCGRMWQDADAAECDTKLRRGKI